VRKLLAKGTVLGRRGIELRFEPKLCAHAKEGHNDKNYLIEKFILA